MIFIWFVYSLVIRGQESDSAVICTDSATFDIKNVSTSNTLMLFDDLVIDFNKSNSTDMDSEQESFLITQKVC